MMSSTTRLLAINSNNLRRGVLHRRCLFNQQHPTPHSRCSQQGAQWSHNRSRFSSSSTLSRNFSSLSASNDADDNEKQHTNIRTTDTIVLPKLNLLSALESSPFQATKTPTKKEDDATIEKVTADTAEQAQTAEKKAKPSLEELLKVDLFSQSWSGPDTERYRSSRYSQTYQRDDRSQTYQRENHSQTYQRENRSQTYQRDGRSQTFQRENRSQYQRESRNTSLHSFERNDRRPLRNSNPLGSSTPTYAPTYAAAAAPPSAEKSKLDSILQESNKLLQSLTNNNGSSTLQLMDFDGVMTKLSRFNSEMESEANDNIDERVFRRGHGEKSSLKREAADKCIELLQALEQNYDCILQHARPSDDVAPEDILPETKHSQLMPSASSYNHVLHTLAHSGKGQRVAAEASATLDRMLDRCRKYLEMTKDPSLPLPPPEPTIITFNSTIHAIAKSGAGSSGYMAEEVFSKMEEWHSQCRVQNESDENRSFYKGVAPDPRTLAVVLDAWANRDEVKGFAPERAESILNMAINRRRAYVKSVRGEDSDSSYLDSEVESDSFIDYDDDIIEEEYVDEELATGEDDVQQSAEAELEVKEEATDDSEAEYLQSKESCGPFLRPNTVAFNTCINTWATCGRGRMAAVRTQELLSQMEAISESGELDLPDTIDADGDIDSDESSFVDHSLRPNARSYSMVMKAWANVAKMERWSSEDAAEQCEDILNRMELRGASDVSVRPNLVAYVTTITAWSRTKAAHAPSRADHILNRMIDLYYDGNDVELPSLEGDVEHAKHDAPFNAVITAYARSSDPNAAERAFAVLERLEVSPIAPTVFTYNAVMDVCAKHGDPERALQTLEKMQALSVTPDSTSYDTILNAFARHDKSGSADRAWELLRQWEEERAAGENDTFIPSQVGYSAVINGFAKASGTEYGGMSTVKKAKEVYDRLIEQKERGVIYGESDPVANSCFLNCCANIYGTRAERKEALILAIKAFEEMKKNPSLHGEPGQFTFGTMMKACSKLSADAAERNRLLESLFQQSCNRGLLSKSTLGQFLRHTPDEFSTKVILQMGGSKREIPPEWHRNVPGKHKPTPTERDRY